MKFKIGQNTNDYEIFYFWKNDSNKQQLIIKLIRRQIEL
ncbi:unnamed protein product [Paramecium sonneborni]|uniref:Uncharacterized protein n=1 Tax=Paramecium sonneborni TaxID=65129 RepID=A0A8S1P5A1_9CILI|nr:unnamed protein product [Paramecium sonneborni]